MKAQRSKAWSGHQCPSMGQVVQAQGWTTITSSCSVGIKLMAEHKNAVKTNQDCLKQGQREGPYFTACLQPRLKSSMATCRDLLFFHLFSSAAPGVFPIPCRDLTHFTYHSKSAPVNQLLQLPAGFQHLLTGGDNRGVLPHPFTHSIALFFKNTAQSMMLYHRLLL